MEGKTEQKTIWAVSSGSYSDYRVEAIFSTEEKAKEYLVEYKKVVSDADIEEFDLDPQPIKAGFAIRVDMLKDGTVRAIRKLGIIQISGERTGLNFYYGNEMAGWIINTDDETTAIKAANEKRIQAIALNVWGNFAATKEIGL